MAAGQGLGQAQAQGRARAAKTGQIFWKYKNYKIPISRNAENEISYPYQLEEGASDQHIALELLKKKGFDISLVEDAINVCELLKKIDVKDSDELVYLFGR